VFLASGNITRILNFDVVAYVKAGTIALSTFIFALFILFIILFETIVADPISLCGDHVVIYDARQAFILLVSYRAIFSFISILHGTALLIVGYKIYILLLEKKHAKRHSIGLVSLVGGFGLIAQAVALIVLVSLNGPQNAYVVLSILLVVEIIPSLLFLSMAEIHPIEGKNLVPAVRATIGKATGAKTSGGPRTGSSKGKSSVPD